MENSTQVFLGLHLADWLGLTTVLLGLAILIILIVLLRRPGAANLLSALAVQSEILEKGQERLEKAVRGEIAQNREESLASARHNREEIAATLNTFAGGVQTRMTEIAGLQKAQLDSFAQQLMRLTQTNEQKLELLREKVEQHLRTLQQESSVQLTKTREEAAASARELREEVGLSLKNFRDSLINNMGEMAALQKRQLDSFAEQLDKFAHTTEQRLQAMREAIETGLRLLQAENSKKLDQMREDSTTAGRQQRDEMGQSLKGFNDSVLKGMTDMGQLLKDQMDSFARQIQALMASNAQQQEALRKMVENRLQQMQEDNSKRLEQMRATVDEKLQGTLEKRLGESFQQVSQRLEQVHKGLGEMQSLATGVGDLKRVLTNVKSRGTWGEIQLEALLEHLLAPEQYAKNVKMGDLSGDAVEFALRLPGRGDGDGVWLPIDAKFPLEDYDRLVEAQEKADAPAMEAAAKNLLGRIKTEAKKISDKYVLPPRTTDFAVMFLPNEGLYAEVIRRPGLVETIQREHRVVIAGPTTFAALLNSLQMGFRTLAIQKRSSEVWQLLGAVKTEFGKFGDILTGVKKKLEQASHTMDDAARRSRAIERKLKGVQELPSEEARLFLPEEPGEPEVL